MSAVKARRAAAVLGALAADAAAQPLHWIYDDNKLKAIVGDREDVEFWQPSHNPFYRIPVGKQTCYGDQLLVVLESLVEQKGVNCEALKTATCKRFGPGSAYDNTENARYIVGREDKINVKRTLPIQGPWRHASIKHFLSNMEAGKENPGSELDDQIDCVLRMIPACALFAGRPEMLDRVEDVLRVTQDSDMSVAVGLAAARILEQFILHGSERGMAAVVDQVVGDLGDKHRQNPQGLDLAVAGQLKKVSQALTLSHRDAVAQHFRKD